MSCWFTPRFSHFPHVFNNCVFNNSKRKTQLRLERVSWVVVGGRWLLAVPSCTEVEWQQQLTSGKTSTVLQVSLLERQVTRKVHVYPTVTLSTQSGYAKVGTSFCLSYIYYIYVHTCVSYMSCICKRYISSTYKNIYIYVTRRMPCSVLTTLDIRYLFFTTLLPYNTNILIIPFCIEGK